MKGKPLHYDWDDWEEKIWYESCGRGLHSRFIGFSFKVLERTLPLLADSVSCASGYLKDLAERFGVCRERLSETPVGADMEKFNSSVSAEPARKKHGLLNREEIVLYIGQLHGAQYVDLFIQAASIILRKRPDVRFFIVGEGFMEWKLRQMVNELRLGHRVIFTGSVSHSEIPFYIAAATVCVAPFRDTLVTRCKSPLKIVEYMASGKAIVASDVGEVRKMLGGAGILTPPGDFGALADGILLVLGNEALRADLENASRKRVESTYNWANTAQCLLNGYEKILKQNKSRNF
ncbi:MAG TPA: glycosyltransferase family 4 protein [Candidatus Omnitrophota bacterium]|nr:glycosyltransferase family 4 protein [Candidatus Omnitrophota bacterium]